MYSKSSLYLQFILSMAGGLTLTKNYVQLYKHSFYCPLISEFTVKCGDTHLLPAHSSSQTTCCTKDNGKCTCSDKLEHQETIYLQENQEEPYDETHQDLQLLAELADIQLHTQREIPPELQSYIDKLQQEGTIGENPILFQHKNKFRCTLEILNPELKIKTSEIKASNLELKEYEMHIKELEQLNVIQRSSSPHRSAAFIVNKHSEQVRGKTRMVINYKRLNDNTKDDAYKLPGKDMLINRIQNARYFTKIDLKSGFWQIQLDQQSIPWTAFTVPMGHYEWLVMPFGLKNAPSIFQRMMDTIFKQDFNFVSVYVDDILIFSRTKPEHVKHVTHVLQKLSNNGLVASRKKMNICLSHIQFLGAEIGNGYIHLQDHVSTKIINFKEEDLTTIKGMRQFLGLLNYAKPYIKDLGKMISCLYQKTSPKGQQNLNQEDRKLIQQVKHLVTTLPKLKLPLDTDYLIIETDGSSEGWGAILKSKPHKYANKNTEQLCRYNSGKFQEKGKISTIESELLAVTYSMTAFELFLLGKPEITLRIDCDAIVRFHKTLNDKKSAHKRWTNFLNSIIDEGLKVTFEHIKGTDNSLSDTLSRLITH
ncbi:hypothetical protein Ancab_040598 [Ancistrocladus abbreviatus]